MDIVFVVYAALIFSLLVVLVYILAIILHDAGVPWWVIVTVPIISAGIGVGVGWEMTR